jgi:cyclohexadienyl dehydratase
MRALALFVTALWAAIVAPALADSSRLDAILERHVLRVGTTSDYRPFTALDKGTGEYSGFDIDMARALAKALGVSIAFAPTTWSGLAQGLAEGNFDIVWAASRSRSTGRRQVSSPPPTCATARRRSRAARIRRNFRP